MSHIIKEMKEKLHKKHINRVAKSKISEKAKLPMIEILKNTNIMSKYQTGIT